MVLDYIENIAQYLMILVGLLFSVTYYISSKNRSWLCTVGFFTAYFLSCYLWTAYLIVMDDQPVVSDFIINLGWNLSFIMLFLLLFQMKSREERRYFHPVMLLPIPLNAAQLILYSGFDGVGNSIYQCTICTVVSFFALQSIMWYRRERRNGATPPYIAVIVLIAIIAEFGMWTFSCFDGFIGTLYYPSSFLCSLNFMLLVWAVRRTYQSDADIQDTLLRKKIQTVFKLVYIVIVLSCSTGGIFLGKWLKDILVDEETGEQASCAYEIISVILFVISAVLAAFAIFTIFIVYYEQKSTENHRLREAMLVAEHSNAAKSDFLANMSHEIRTPINAVLGMNKLIMRESIKARDFPPKDKEIERKVFSSITSYSANIDSAGNNLLSIINDILDFSKIEAGKIDITEHDYMLSSVLNDVSNTVLFKAKDKGIVFRVDADANLPDILYGDEVRIRQIMTNILNNAVKYTDKGSVLLSVHSGVGAKYEPGGMIDLVIAVKDTGIGIKEEDIEKIFDKFERTDLKRNSTVEGTGLGLAITKRLLGMMNGTIHVESVYGRGSAFTVIVPQKIVSDDPIGNFREKFEKSIENADVMDNVFRAPEAQILIVDDTRMNLTVAAGLISDTEIVVHTAESGAEALEMTLAEKYDIILMDQRMPGMDGTETLRRLRERDKDDKTPVICLTADAISGAKENYIAKGFNDYLSKPIDSHSFKRMLMKYLPPEKIILVSGDDTASDDAPAGTSGDGNDALYEALRAAGIDTASGLGYCSDNDDLYRTLLLQYVQSADDKTSTIRRTFESGSWKNYATVVHSLKSTSRTIGAISLSELAAELEKAADEENTELISGGTEELLEKYRETVSAITSAGIAVETADSDDDDIMEFMPK